MKHYLTHSTKLAGIFLALFFIISFCGKTAAQEKEFYNISAKEQTKAIKNLDAGIKDSNDGLRRSSVYLAGYYQINELVSVLAQQLYKTTDSKDRVLLLMALYKIGGQESHKAIQDFIASGSDEEATQLARTMVNEFAPNNPSVFSFGK
jgi:hypothetical protein